MRRLLVRLGAGRVRAPTGWQTEWIVDRRRQRRVACHPVDAGGGEVDCGRRRRWLRRVRLGCAMASSTSSIAQRHRRIAAAFTERVRGTTDWEAASPVADWRARDVVRHLLEWLPPFISGAGVALSKGPSVDEDPVAAWQHRCAEVQALLEDPEVAQRVLVNPHLGEMPLAAAIDRFYTSDVFMHTWDLSRATGQDDRLDPDECATLLAGLEPMDELLRASGQFGPKVPVPDDADVQTRLIGFIGRDPFWTPA